MRIEVALAMKTVKNHNILAYRCTIKSVQRGNVIVRVFEIFSFTICHYFHFETSQGLFFNFGRQKHGRRVARNYSKMSLVSRYRAVIAAASQSVMAGGSISRECC